MIINPQTYLPKSHKTTLNKKSELLVEKNVKEQKCLKYLSISIAMLNLKIVTLGLMVILAAEKSGHEVTLFLARRCSHFKLQKCW